MADRLVVGIYPDTDPKALESALAAQQLDLSKIKVVDGNCFVFLILIFSIVSDFEFRVSSFIPGTQIPKSKLR